MEIMLNILHDANTLDDYSLTFTIHTFNTKQYRPCESLWMHAVEHQKNMVRRKCWERHSGNNFLELLNMNTKCLNVIKRRLQRELC